MKKEVFNRPVTEIIQERRSVRTFQNKNVSQETKKLLNSYLEEIQGPFASKVRIEWINNEGMIKETGGKIGTYGVIKGAQDYIVTIIEKTDEALIDLGYVLEELIVYATSLGLGTCWLGGTFKKSDLIGNMTIGKDEHLPIITPIGYPKNKSMTETLMRFAAGSNKRKEWDELFYTGTFKTPISKEDNPYTKALEAVRWAPSASNKQPWRVLQLDNKYHFYLNPTKGYGEKLGYDIQRIDIGIAMCHFQMVLEDLGINGNWTVDKPKIDEDGCTYISTWEAV